MLPVYGSINASTSGHQNYSLESLDHGWMDGQCPHDGRDCSRATQPTAGKDFKMTIRQTIRTLLPTPALRFIRKVRGTDDSENYKNLSTQEIFSRVYEKKGWGKSGDPSQPFFSGPGSHDGAVVSDYIRSVHDFLATFEKKPDVVDLGCGDFFIGSKIRDLCNNFTVCDIVPALIEFNKEKYKELAVDFRVLDLSVDELPDGDVVFVRQVLQHLSNAQIMRAVSKIKAKYKYLVLTEHLPDSRNFKHNLDKPAGPDIRREIKSGVVLTSEPFNLAPQSQREICRISEYGGIIATTVYQFSG